MSDPIDADDATRPTPTPPTPAAPATVPWGSPAAAPQSAGSWPAAEPATGAPVAWQAPTPEAGPAPGFEFGGFGARLVAYVLDGILVSIITGTIFVIAALVAFGGTELTIDAVTGQVDPDSVRLDAGAWTIFAILVFVAILIAIAYFPFFWARGGSTPGMRPFGLIVVRDRDGGRIGWGTALLRLIGMYVSSLVFYLGFIWVFVDKRRRGWHDLIAGTVVIRRV